MKRFPWLKAASLYISESIAFLWLAHELQVSLHFWIVAVLIYALGAATSFVILWTLIKRVCGGLPLDKESRAFLEAMATATGNEQFTQGEGASGLAHNQASVGATPAPATNLPGVAEITLEKQRPTRACLPSP